MMHSPSPIIPTIEDVRTAAKRIALFAVRTPLLETPELNEFVGGRLLIKAESLQRTGSFKFRGAFNTISQIIEKQNKNGVVACGSTFNNNAAVI